MVSLIPIVMSQNCCLAALPTCRKTKGLSKAMSSLDSSCTG